MDLSRRTVLSGIAAGVGLAALPGWRVQAMELGGWEVMTLSDGHLTLPSEFIFGPMPTAELAPLREEFGVTGSVLTPPCNVTLLRRDNAVILFDCGAGTGFQDSAGQLIDALDAVGVTPEDVTHVVFTHGHPDHLWGVLDDFDDPVFYGATHMMGRVERDYWLDPNTPASIGDARVSFAVGAARRLAAIADGLEVFDDGVEILPGVAARASFGHSPGHMAFEIRNGGDSVLVLGDAIGNGHLAFARPEWASGSDQDPDLAAKTRASLLDQAATDQAAVIGFHLPGGGLGRVAREGRNYRFVGVHQ